MNIVMLYGLMVCCSSPPLFGPSVIVITCMPQTGFTHVLICKQFTTLSYIIMYRVCVSERVQCSKVNLDTVYGYKLQHPDVFSYTGVPRKKKKFCLKSRIPPPYSLHQIEL